MACPKYYCSSILTIFVSLYVTNQGNYTKVNILSLYKHTVVNSEELYSEVTYLYIFVFPLDCEILHPYLVVFSLDDDSFHANVFTFSLDNEVVSLAVPV